MISVVASPSVGAACCVVVIKPSPHRMLLQANHLFLSASQRRRYRGHP